MIKVRFFVASSLISLFSLGCANSSSLSPSAPSAPGGSTAITADQLAGSWTFASMQRPGQPEQTAPSGTNLTVSFTDGRVAARLACNSCGGSFTLSGQTLTAGTSAGLACTRAWCPAIDFDELYTSVLAGESTAALSGGTLVLTSARGVLRFTR